MSATNPVLKVAQGEILFNEGDVASSLFILKKGQLRLYKEKGNGFIDLAVLRAGEVLGEMSYFDAQSNRRNCSASAMTDLEYIEVSFDKFSKVIENLNPWFKTIIRTLVDRLNKANSRIKSLESVSAVDYGDKSSGLQNLKVIDISKILSTIFLCFKGHASNVGNKFTLKKDTLSVYSQDVYNITEAKVEQVLMALEKINLLQSVTEGDSSLLLTENLDEIRSTFVSFNAERHLLEDKKMKISKRCFLLLEKVWEVAQTQTPTDDFVQLDLGPILRGFKAGKVNVTIDDLQDAKENGLVENVLVDGDTYTLPVNYTLLKKHISFLRLKDHFSK